MIIHYQPREPLIAGFFGYAPLIQASLFLLVTGSLGGPVRLVRVHAWTQRGKRIDQAYRQALGRGRPVRESDLRDQPHEEVEPLAAGPLNEILVRLLREAQEAAHQGFAGESWQVLRYCFAHPQVLGHFRGDMRQAIPDELAPDATLPRHPQLWDCRWMDGDHRAMVTLLRCFIRQAHPAPAEGACPT